MRISNALWLRDLLRWLLGALFLWAAVSKLANPIEFLGSVYAYQIPLPRSVLKCVAVVLPWTELLCALLLLAGMWMETALLLTFSLLSVFLLATGQAWLRGLTISCGCFDLNLLGLGNADSLKKVVESVGFALVRNGILAAVSFYLLRFTMARESASDAESERVVSTPSVRSQSTHSAKRRAKGS